MVDVDKIDGIELIEPGVESATCGGSCYYFKDGIICNQKTGQKKRLSGNGVHVYQMEYQPSDDSLALATNVGV